MEKAKNLEEIEKNEPGKTLSYLLITAVGIILIFSIVQAFQLNSLQGQLNQITGKVDQITGKAVSVGSTGLDQSGWTENEKMMYEHHGTLPARLQAAGKAGNLETIPAMVGGC